MNVFPQLVSDHIHAAITRRPHERTGPFLAAFAPDTADIWRNYAVPDDGAKPSRHDVTNLIAAFHHHDRVPRLEYVPTAAPDVEAALIEAGFTVEGRPPIMVSTPDVELTPREPTGITVELANGDPELLEVATVQHDAYHQPDPAGPHEVARLNATVARGGLVAIARDTRTGAAVGAALIDRTDPHNPIGELAAVAVLTRFRRRGIASAVSVSLARAAHHQGMRLVWLEAAPAEDQIYTRAGFITAGKKLWISLR